MCETLVNYSEKPPELVDISGNLLQVFSNDNDRIRVFGISPDGLTIVTIGKEIYIWDRLPSYERFREEGQYEELSISDLIEFDLIDFNEALNTLSGTELYKAAQFYLAQSKSSGFNEREEYLSNSYALLDKLVNSSDELEYALSFLEVNFELQSIKPSKKLIRTEEKLIKKLREMDGEREILKTADFFSGRANNENNRDEKIKMYRIAILFYERLMQLSTDRDLSMRAFTPYNNLSLDLLYIGEFDEALKNAEKGLNLSDIPIIQTKLALGLLFNSRTEDGLKIIKLYGDSIVNQITFREYILDKIEDLNRSGIELPNYDRVMEAIQEPVLHED